MTSINFGTVNLEKSMILPREATHKPNGAWGSGEQSEMQKALEVIVR